MHARAPDVASGLARQGVIDSANQHLGTERQQKLEDTVTEVIEVPAGLAEETMKRAVMFEAAQLPGLNDACERAAAGAENPCAGQRPERGEAGLGKAGLKGEQEGSKGTDEQIGHSRLLIFHFISMKDKERKKRTYCRWRLRSFSRSRFTPAICFSTFCI